MTRQDERNNQTLNAMPFGKYKGVPIEEVPTDSISLGGGHVSR